MMDIESSTFSWSSLTSLHHTKHTTTSNDPSEDDINRSFEVCICFIHVPYKLLLFVGTASARMSDPGAYARTVG